MAATSGTTSQIDFEAYTLTLGEIGRKRCLYSVYLWGLSL